MSGKANDILSYWEDRAISKSSGKLVTHRDAYQVSIEIKTILDLLNRSDTLLDIGCGNGFATSGYARKCRKVTGVDYSANMIKSAKAAFRRDNLDFKRSDVLNIGTIGRSFSAAVSTRCLINLTNWRDQKRAIINIHGILGRGGRLILVEGIKEGRRNLNVLRNRIGLPSMPGVWHNLDFDYARLMPFLKKHFIVRKEIRFGVYDVLTRAYYPASIYPEEPRYNTSYHSCAEKLHFLNNDGAFSEYSREICLELIKK
ncbi:MAG: class I SAM-dependent methyltransferase [Candidatus Omnitrophota bacterium]